MLIPTKKFVSDNEIVELFILGGIKHSARNRVLFRIYYIAISRYKPKIILGITLPPILCLAAHLNGVKTFEFQHGIGFKEEFDFQTVLQCSPDLLLMWHETYTATALELGRASLTIGFPIERNQLKVSQRPIPLELENSRVLITLSYSVYNSVDQFGYVHQQVADSIIQLNSIVEKITLRLHPAIEVDLEMIPWRRFSYRVIKNSLLALFPEVNIEFSSEKPLADSLQENDIHISYKSSSIFEAAVLGVPTVLLAQNEKELLLPPEVEGFNLLRYSDAENLLPTVKKLLSSPRNRILNELNPSIISLLLYS
jgi:CDP-glycerol glycerophosphotransferase (TagB/SpsB family)